MYKWVFVLCNPEWVFVLFNPEWVFVLWDPEWVFVLETDLRSRIEKRSGGKTWR